MSNVKESLVNVAVVQMEPVIGEREKNLKRSIEFITEAASNGANLIILPELCISGYVFESREEANQLAEEIPNGLSVQSWIKVAKEYQIYISAGINERDGVKLYNSSVLIGPDGYIGKYRKNHLWYEEKLFFEPGDLGFPIFHTPIGKISPLICYDIFFPESTRIVALKGADIICVNTNWVPVPGHDPNERPMANNICLTEAHRNGVFIAASDRVGEERGLAFLGRSLIVAPNGVIKAGPASITEEVILYSQCNLAESRRGKHWNEFNNPIKDRRTDVYDVMLGTGEKNHRW